MLSREIVETEDGSHSFHVKEIDEHYHSVHGAIQESNHIFIQNNFSLCQCNPVSILEVGFGTGLNALLTLYWAKKTGRKVRYETIELYPLREEEYRLLNYASLVDVSLVDVFTAMHECAWDAEIQIDSDFVLYKRKVNLLDWRASGMYDVVYFDAFSPDKQPELWSDEVFREIASHTSPGGILSTYCAKGAVKRSLKNAGFSVEHVPGPPGKREITIARKI